MPKKQSRHLARLDRLGAELGARLDARCFQSVADYTSDWESWHAPDGRLVWVNRAVERITGYAVAECLDMEDYPLPMVISEDRRRAGKILASAQERTTGESIELRGVRRCGARWWMSLSWQPMFAERGDYLGFRTSVRDVTERQKMREQLRLHADHLEQLVQERTARLRQLELRQRTMEKLAALGQLAAGVAHEINNPLAGIRNAFELIKSDLGEAHPRYELLGLIDAEIERISGIIHQMYQLYRRNPQSSTRFSLHRAVRQVVFLLDNVATKQHVQLQLQSQQVSPDVVLPEGEVKQILYNLIRNAIEASPAGAAVAISVEDHENETIVHVRDRGSGVPPDVLPRIFDPFFSTKQSTDSQGMGLGLSVSRSLIEAMGGRIDVVGDAQSGSLFSAVFPRTAEFRPELLHG